MTDQPFVWEPAQYGKFGDFRDRPFFDLTSRIGAVAPASAVDLGCGPGNLTATLARRWPQASVVGLDSSAGMVEKAQGLTVPGLSFVQGDIAAWSPLDGASARGAPPDVIVSNAALQWVSGHRELMSGWLATMHPGAWLGVQVPGNFGAPSHVLMRELAESSRWRKQLGGVLQHDDVVAEPAVYQELFLSGGARVDVWETTDNQLLQGENAVLEWVRGTALRPILSALSASEAEEFEGEYTALLAAAYPAGAHGTIYPFRRIFMVGEKQ